MPVKKFSMGDLSAYSSGGGIAEGDYVWKDLTVVMHQYTKQSGESAGPARLGVMITLTPLAGGEDSQQFYPLGSKAHESWAPNPETGKGLVPVPGGPGASPNKSTNWAYLLKSLYDCGLPNGVFDDDTSVLEGIHVHMANVPEPEERKSFQSKTGEAAEQTGPKTIPIVTEIKEDGKPWEGTGGLPDAKKAVKGKVATPPAKAAVKTKPAPEPVEEAEEAPAAEGLEDIALAATGDVLSTNEKGCSRLILRTSSFKYIKGKYGDAKANEVINTYYTKDDQLNSIINQHGYKIAGMMIVAA